MDGFTKDKNGLFNGHASSFKEEYCQQMIDFFRDHAGEGRIIKSRDANAKVQYELDGDLPTFEEFAGTINKSKRTLDKWSKDFESFGEAYSVCKDIQARFLQKFALVTNSKPAQMMLAAQHGFVVKTEQSVDMKAKIDADVTHRTGVTVYIPHNGRDAAPLDAIAETEIKKIGN